jgi:hypothetical protein
MLISVFGATVKATGSLTTGAPAGIVTEGCPPKVITLAEPGLMLSGLVGIATVAAPTSSGTEPNSLESRIRICAPPTDTRTRSRTVWPSILLSGSFGERSSACGLLAQVATHPVPTPAVF